MARAVVRSWSRSWGCEGENDGRSETGPSESRDKGVERRAFPRLPWRSLMPLDLGEGTEIQDFSPSGIGFRANHPIHPHQIFELTPQGSLAFGGAKVPCEVLWARPDRKHDVYVGGARFLHVPSGRVNQPLTKYLYSVLKSGQHQVPVSFAPLILLEDEVEATRVVERVKGAALPPFFAEMVDRAKGFTRRRDYAWKWCYEAMKHTQLSCVDPIYSHLLDNTKLCGFLLSILLDDLADEAHDPTLIQEAIKMMQSRNGLDVRKVPPADRPQADFLNGLWDMIQKNVWQFPRYFEFRDLLYYDFERIADTLRYAHLSNNRTRMINEQEAILHEGNNINVMIDAMLDIMCSPAFVHDELGNLREIAWHGQMMCKIANWVATWRREVAVNDWTSGIIAAALRANVISHADLDARNDKKVIEKIENSCVEADFLWKWEQHRSWILENVGVVRSVDVKRYLAGLEKFFQMQLFSKGLQ